MNGPKPRKVIAKVRRTVVETAIVTLDRYGCVEEYQEQIKEPPTFSGCLPLIHPSDTYDDVELISIIKIMSVH